MILSHEEVWKKLVDMGLAIKWVNKKIGYNGHYTTSEYLLSETGPEQYLIHIYRDKNANAILELINQIFENVENVIVMKKYLRRPKTL